MFLSKLFNIFKKKDKPAAGPNLSGEARTTIPTASVAVGTAVGAADSTPPSPVNTSSVSSEPSTAPSVADSNTPENPIVSDSGPAESENNDVTTETSTFAQAPSDSEISTEEPAEDTSIEPPNTPSSNESGPEADDSSSEVASQPSEPEVSPSDDQPNFG